MNTQSFYTYTSYRDGAFNALVYLKNYLNRGLIYNNDKYINKNNLNKIIDCLIHNLDYFLEYGDMIDLGFIFNDKRKTKIDECRVIK